MALPVREYGYIETRSCQCLGWLVSFSLCLVGQYKFDPSKYRYHHGVAIEELQAFVFRVFFLRFPRYAK